MENVLKMFHFGEKRKEERKKKRSERRCLDVSVGMTKTIQSYANIFWVYIHSKWWNKKKYGRSLKRWIKMQSKLIVIQQRQSSFNSHHAWINKFSCMHTKYLFMHRIASHRIIWVGCSVVWQKSTPTTSEYTHIRLPIEEWKRIIEYVNESLNISVDKNA